MTRLNHLVRVRLCYAGHEESVVGTLVGFRNTYSGFDATYGLVLSCWHYEYGDKAKHRGDLFIKWESVFVIEEIDEHKFWPQLRHRNQKTEGEIK